MKTWRADLNKRLGETIFLSAQRDYVTGNLRRRTPIAVATYVISALVLATPIAMFLVGLALIYFGHSSILVLIFAAVFLTLGWWLLPRRAKLPPGGLLRNDLPETFAMTDKIGAALNAPKITAILLTEEFNASVGQTRNHTILTIGAVLWDSLEPDQKIALVAHEMAHLVNNDPSKAAFVGAAISTLERWSDLFLPAQIIDPFEGAIDDKASDLIGEVITATLGTIVDLIWSALERLNFIPQQRAEYLADALSAEVAGAKAPASLLKHLEMFPRVLLEFRGMSSRNAPEGRDMIQRLARAARDVPEHERAALLEDMNQTSHNPNATHPPSAFRLAFLQTLPKHGAKVIPSDFDFAAIDVELAPHFDRIGTRIADRLIVQ